MQYATREGVLEIFITGMTQGGMPKNLNAFIKNNIKNNLTVLPLYHTV